MLDTATSVSVDGNTAYVAGRDADSLTAIDISNPASLSILASITDPQLSGADGVTVDGSTAYVANFSGERLTTIEILR